MQVFDISSCNLSWWQDPYRVLVIEIKSLIISALVTLETRFKVPILGFL